MNVVNFDREMQRVISDIKKTGEKPTLLLHSCCAPCSSTCIERLKDYFDITVYYYNPNLDTEKEFNLRAAEQQRLCEEFKVKFIVENYNPEEFLSVVSGLETCPEGGARCRKCFKLRLEKTARAAMEKGLTYFATTLTLSPLKNARLINQLSEEISKTEGVQYLPSDFKKQNGYLRSIELSKEYGLYRQNYCGCAFSKLQK